MYKEILEMETTPYRKATLLCIAWLEKYPLLSEKYPSRGMHAACREYDLLHAVEDYYTVATGDVYPPHTGDSEPRQAWFGRMLTFGIENEDPITRNLSGLMEKKEIKDIGLAHIDGKQIGLLGEIQPAPVKKERIPNTAPRAKPEPEYVQACLKEIEAGNLPEYMPVRECAAQFTGTAQKDFLHHTIRIAKALPEVKVKSTGRFNQERIMRVAGNMLRELNKSDQTELGLA